MMEPKSWTGQRKKICIPIDKVKEYNKDGTIIGYFNTKAFSKGNSYLLNVHSYALLRD